MQITLYFADFNVSAVGERIFDIKINGDTVASNVDVYELGGGDFSAVSMAVSDFYSGVRSSFDVTLPTVVGHDSPKPCLSLCLYICLLAKGRCNMGLYQHYLVNLRTLTQSCTYPERHS